MTADAGKRSAAADRAPAGDPAPGKGATKTRAARQKTKREPAAKKPPLSPDLAVVQTQVFRGPNYWSYEPCIRMLVDLGSLEFWPSNTIPGFNEEAPEGACPASGSTRARSARGAGSRNASRTARGSGHVAEHVALELQRETGAHISRGKTRSAGPPGQYNVIYGYAEETVGLAAGALAVRLLNHLVKAEDGFDFEAEREALILLAERRQFGPSTQAIIDEAVTRDIPWIRLNEHSLVQLGQGTYQQRIRATMTSKTSALAVDIAGDKKMTNQLLASAGLPVPRSEVVRTEDDAVAAAKRIGFPVVTKPLDGNHGRGVGLDLRTDRAVRGGFRRARVRSAPRPGGGGVLRHRQRLSRAGDRRAHGGDRRAGARARHRRRQAHDRPAGREGRTRIHAVASATRRC